MLMVTYVTQPFVVSIEFKGGVATFIREGVRYEILDVERFCVERNF